MLASLTGVSYDSVSFGSWFCSDNTVVIVMFICGNDMTIGNCFITVCAVGISTVAAKSAGWRGVVTFCGVFVSTFTSVNVVSNSFSFIIAFVFTSVNCGSGIVSDIQIFSFI